jgi:hypothetical protein
MEGFQRTPGKIFCSKDGQLDEAIQTASYDYNETANTVGVERQVVTSEAQPTSRVDVLKWFCK